MFMIYLIHNFLNIFRPLLRPSSEWYYYKNTKVQMWLAVSPSRHKYYKLLKPKLKLYK
jgi:hypothetical protein